MNTDMPKPKSSANSGKIFKNASACEMFVTYNFKESWAVNRILFINQSPQLSQSPLAVT